MTKGEKEETKFQIDQLRKDKVIYAVESVALSMLALLILFALVSGALPVLLGDLPLSPTFGETLLKVVLGVPAIFWVYVVVGNLMRLKKIKSLEGSLK